MRRLPLLVALLPLLAAACAASEARVSALLPPAERQPAPAVAGETLDGEDLALADLAGAPVVVNFWASWCGPCVQEAPELRNLALAYAGRAHVVGVNVNDSRVNARRFERDLDVPYPSWPDPSYEVAASFGGIGPAAIPSTIVLDADGRVAVRLIGAVTFSQVRTHLDALLAETGP